MIDKLKSDIIRDEALRLKPYKDSVGKLTIGVGRNLDDKGISTAEARILLDNDIADALRDLDRNVPWWRDLPEDVRRGLANMSFNMGWPKLSEFKKMLRALRERDWDRAADEALNSKWARQVGPRSERIAELYRAANVDEAAPAPQETSPHWWPFW